MRKTISSIIISIVTFAAIAGLSLLAGSSSAFATQNAEGATLDVYVDETFCKSYDMDALETLWVSEGSEEYTYSGYNTYPTAKLVKNACGPSVYLILKDALGEEAFNSISDNQMIEFVARDGAREGLTKEQLLEDRFYYPDFEQELYKRGKPVRAEDKNRKVPVPAIISLYEDGESYDPNMNTNIGRLLFGQTTPREQNHGAFINKMTPVEKNKKTSIIVHSESGGQWNAIQSLTGAEGNTVVYGSEFGFDRDVNINNHGFAAGRYWIYYTTDGTEPTCDSEMYNYNNFSFDRPEEKINRPVITVYGPAAIKTMVGGYGKQDSDISTFNVNVVPASPTVTAKAASYQSIQLAWTGGTGIKEYRIYRSTNNFSGFQQIKTVTGTAYTDTALSTGTAYYYKVTACANASNGSTVVSNESAVATATPVMSKPVIKALKLKKKTITVKWNKVAGASGYKIYRSLKKNGSYKLIKNIKGGNVLSFKNKKLKKKKKYYYKVRAYRTISGKTVYSSYSAVKYKKVK